MQDVVMVFTAVGGTKVGSQSISVKGLQD